MADKKLIKSAREAGMKVRILSGMILHLGAPWDDTRVCFRSNSKRKILSMWGLAYNRTFIGTMKLSP